MKVYIIEWDFHCSNCTQKKKEEEEEEREVKKKRERRKKGSMRIRTVISMLKLQNTKIKKINKTTYYTIGIA